MLRVSLWVIVAYGTNLVVIVSSQLFPKLNIINARHNME